MRTARARFWVGGVYGPTGETRCLAPSSKIWGSLGGSEGCLEAASHPLQPPDFPEGILTKFHSLVVTSGETSDLLPALLPESNSTNH